MLPRIADWLRKMADRMDHYGAPKATHWHFTFERGEGLVFNEEGRGCRVWYLNDDEYERAHSEALRPV